MTKSSRGRHLSIRLLLSSLLIMGMANTLTFSQMAYITYEEAVASLTKNRDRLLDSYASQTGRADRHQAWSEMSSSQKGVFLTITDLLGRRTFMNYNSNHSTYYSPDYDDELAGCQQLNQQHLVYFPNVGEEELVYITTSSGMGQYGICELQPRNVCEYLGKCAQSPLPRIDHDMALNHATTLYAINGANGGSCGGGEYNRMFFAADDVTYGYRHFLHQIRNPYPGMPEWEASTDPAGPHSPFTVSVETNGGFFGGFPKGQMHAWDWDFEASVLARNGVYGVYDPSIVEIDIDYEWSGHPSNPECYYDGVLGRYKYQNKWWNYGLGGSAEFEYSPSVKIRTN
jgi:hypothetical protein